MTDPYTRNLDAECDRKAVNSIVSTSRPGIQVLNLEFWLLEVVAARVANSGAAQS